MIRLPTHFPLSENDKLLTIKEATFGWLHRFSESTKLPILLENHLILYVRRGIKVMHSAATGPITIEPESACFFKKGLYLTSEKIISTDGYESIMVFLSDALVRDFISRNGRHLMCLKQHDTPPSYVELTGYRRLASYFQSLMPFFEAPQESEPLLELKFDELLLGLALDDTTQTFRNFMLSLGSPSQIHMQTLMLENFTKNLSVEDFAFLSSMSVSSFRRRFAEHFGTSPQRWLRIKRLEKASQLLVHTAEPIGQISLDVGFESPSHFIDVFKKTYGMTPGQYRQSRVA